MVINAHIDVSYFRNHKQEVEQEVFYMGVTNEDINRPNGAIMVIFTIMLNLMSSAAEAECGELLYNAKELETLSTTLREMGHPQQAT